MSVVLTDLDASLQHRKAKGVALMKKKLTSGWGRLGKFRKLRVTNRIVLGSLVAESMTQPGAKGAFNAKDNVIKIEARIAEVKPAKIDMLITEQKRLALEATYFAEVEGTDGRDPKNFFLADHIFETIIEMAGKDTMLGVWNGVLNSSGTAATDVVNGLVKLVDLDILSDDIPESLVLTHSVSGFYLQESNIIGEFKAMVKKFRTKLPAYAYLPATLYCAPERLSEYQFALEAANGDKMTYNKFEQPVLYFAKNIIIEPVIELAGTDFLMIVPDDNFVYLTDRNGDKVNLDSDYAKRDRSIAMVADWWYAPNYVRADLIVTNDLRERPEDAEDE